MISPSSHSTLHVIVSQGQSHNPQKRRLEEELAARLADEAGISVLVVPHLYDLASDGRVVSQLRALRGDLVVLGWLYERALRWTLDRHGIRGRVGETTLKNEADEDEDESSEPEPAASTDRVLDSRDVPRRTIYCLDLRLRDAAEPYLTEIRRLAMERAAATASSSADPASADLLQWIHGAPRPEQLQRYLEADQPSSLGSPVGSLGDVAEASERRWYPVIDYSRCTNCMECIDFCLFGVYGVDGSETILVEQPDNCRKGCPACSRVCPEHAIIFPQHKTPTIAGSPATGGGLKIDLSQLFGAPDAQDLAARERDEQLLLAGRAPLGPVAGNAQRQPEPSAAARDDLDRLLDKLDELDL